MIGKKKDKSEETRYPKLMISSATEAVYIMVKPGQGMKVVGGRDKNGIYMVGEYCDSIDNSNLSDYNGIVELSNYDFWGGV